MACLQAYAPKINRQAPVIACLSDISPHLDKSIKHSNECYFISLQNDKLFINQDGCPNFNYTMLLTTADA